MTRSQDNQEFRSWCVEEPEVDLVIDRDSGHVVTARETLSGIEGVVNQLRVDVSQRIAADNPRYLCARCHVPVYVVCLPDRRSFFFRHSIEDGRCSAVTRGPLSEDDINALRYDGQKEGPDHIRIKEQIRRSLECDPEFSGIYAEKVVRGTKPGTWRKPDVQGVFRGVRVVFEAQLSTTFLRIMAERRQFYLEQNAALIWVFKSFPLDSRRLLQDDVFYTNNRNVFIVDEETVAESQRRGCFVMRCIWLQPSLAGNQVKGKWRDELASFTQLTMDRDRQRVYRFDCEGETARLRKIVWDGSWLGEVERYWIDTDPSKLRFSDGWQIIRRGRGQRTGDWLSRDPKGHYGLDGALKSLYSLKLGRPVGWRYTSLIQAVHRSLEVSPDALGVLSKAVTHYGRAKQLADEDKSGKLARRIHAMAGLEPLDTIDWKCVSQQFAATPYDWLLEELFPELYGRPLYYLATGTAKPN